jgi:hypothetical protein
MPERLVFDRTLYSPEAVDSAVALFAEHAKIAVRLDGDDIIAEIEAVPGYDPALVAHTFGNHVLNETIARRQQAALSEDA